MSTFNVGQLAAIGKSGAICRIDDINEDTAKVFVGSKTWLKVEMRYLEPTQEESYHLPKWLVEGYSYKGSSVKEIKRGPVVLSDGSVTTILALLLDYNKEEGFDDAEEITEEVAEEPVPVPPVTPSPTTPIPSQNDFNTAMAGLFGGVADMVVKQVMTKVDPIVEDIKNRAPVVHVFEFNINEKKSEFRDEIFHPCFNQILADLMMGGHVFLWGPAGTGKSYMAKQIAKVMHLDFYAVEKIDDISELVGLPTANGGFVGTPFTDAVLKGGVLLMDEVDSSIPDCLNKTNGLLANGRITLPVLGQVEVHKDFHCICAANTCGQGATELYNTRTPIDAAFLNRFIEVIEFDYCEAIDKRACGNDNEIYDFAIAYRKAIKDAGVKSLMSPRNMSYMYMISHCEQHPLHDNFSKILRNCVLGGMDIDTKNNLISRLRCPNNRWADALKNA